MINDEIRTCRCTLAAFVMEFGIRGFSGQLVIGCPGPIICTPNRGAVCDMPWLGHGLRVTGVSIYSGVSYFVSKHYLIFLSLSGVYRGAAACYPLRPEYEYVIQQYYSFLCLGPSTIRCLSLVCVLVVVYYVLFPRSPLGSGVLYILPSFTV